MNIIKGKTKCAVAGCGRPIVVKKHGLCAAHLQRYYRKKEVGAGKILERVQHRPFRQKAKVSA